MCNQVEELDPCRNVYPYGRNGKCTHTHSLYLLQWMPNIIKFRPEIGHKGSHAYVVKSICVFLSIKLIHERSMESFSRISCTILWRYRTFWFDKIKKIRAYSNQCLNWFWSNQKNQLSLATCSIFTEIFKRKRNYF